MNIRLKTDYQTTDLVSVHKAEAKLGVSDGFDTSNVVSALDGSRKMVERKTDRSILNQTWVLNLDSFPSVIYLPKGILVSVTHVKYYDTDNAQQTLVADTNYRVSGANTDDGRIIAISSWPSVNTERKDPIEIEYISGYGSENGDLTLWAENAILLGLPAMYDGCEAGMAYQNVIDQNRLYFDYSING